MNSLSAAVLSIVVLVVTSPVLARAQTPMASVRVELVQRLQGFSVVLVEGGPGAAAPQRAVTGAAARALADMKDFLPYESYRMLDSQWVLGTAGMSVRLQGPAGEVYELNLQTAYPYVGVLSGRQGPAAAGGPARVHIARFRLTEAGSPGASGARAEQDLAMARQRFGAGIMSRQQLERAEQLANVQVRTAAAAQRATIIDTSFTMDIGETVVVGTSRLPGDKALIVLLTAVPK